MDGLKKKADDLGIEYSSDVEKDTLETLITDREEELNNDINHLREQLEFQKKESKKAFSKRDTALADKRRLSQQIKDLESDEEDEGDTEELKSLKEELDGLKEYKKTTEDAIEARELETLTQVERDKLHLEKELRSFKDRFNTLEESVGQEREDSKKTLEDATKRISSLRTHGLEAEIIKAAHKSNAWNADQIVTLTKPFFTYDEQLDKYTHLERDDRNKIVDELSVVEYIKNFLGKEENENLIKSDVKETFDFKKGETDTKTKFTSKSGEYNIKDPKLIEEADERGFEDINDWIEIKKMMDEKQKTIRSIREGT